MPSGKRCLVAMAILGATLVRADEFKFNETGSRPDVDVVEKIIVDNTAIGFSWVDLPLNRILLIKNGKDRCAIRFLSFARGHDARESTVFRAGDESFSAVAEYVVLPGRKVSRLKLTKLPSGGIGRFILYSPSDNHFRCGRGRLGWEYPTATFLWSTDAETSLAPTNLEDFGQINLEDPDLEWSHYEEGRRIVLRPNPRRK